MNEHHFRLADDCALLPDREGYVVYLGTKQRGFRVKPHVGRWLVQGTPAIDPLIGEAEKSKLVELGALAEGPVRASLTLNTLAPKGVAGWATLSLLLLISLASWTLVVPAIDELAVRVVGGLRMWTTWTVIPFAAVLLTLLHEWGHVVALGALGGRAGRVHVRFGWPWAVTVVGPFQSVLTASKQLLLVSGGVLVESALLSLSLLCLKAAWSNPVVTAVAATEAVYLAFNLFPTPWSDGGQLVAIAFRCVLRLFGRRVGHD